jgi:hypothetical protein
MLTDSTSPSKDTILANWGKKEYWTVCCLQETKLIDKKNKTKQQQQKITGLG